MVVGIAATDSTFTFGFFVFGDLMGETGGGDFLAVWTGCAAPEVKPGDEVTVRAGVATGFCKLPDGVPSSPQ